MAKDSKPQSKEEKKAARAARRAAGKQQRGQMWEALKIQSKQDKLLWPLMIGAVVLSTIVFFMLGKLWGGEWWMLPVGIMTGVLIAMIIFSRRIQGTVYKRAEGQPGAAAWALDQLRTGWRVSPAVAANTHFDAVHRVVGRCGVVLVGEGAAHRVRPLMGQEKKKIARIVGDTPIYELIVAAEDNPEAKPEEVSLKRLNRRLTRYPMNIDRKKVDSLDTRLTSISTKSSMQNQMPKGPMPQGAKMRGMQRTTRRRS